MDWLVRVLLVVFGFFTLGSQTLLFREYLLKFNGNEIGIVAFFSSWLFWIFIGAFVSRKLTRVGKTVSMVFNWMLLYVPLFCLQYFLILNARELLSLEVYELFPLGKLIGFALVLNSPISLLTGLLFPFLVKEFIKQSENNSVGKAYAFEALGGLLAGSLVTLLLYVKLSPLWIIILLLLIVPVVLAIYNAIKKQKSFLLISVLSFFLVLVSALVVKKDYFYQLKKDNLLKDAKIVRTSTSAMGEFIITKRDRQEVVLYNGAVSESFPDESQFRTQLGLALSQLPEKKIKHALLVGGHAFFAEFMSGQDYIGKIDLYHPDKDYFPNVMHNSFKGKEKIRIIEQDLYRFLDRDALEYDAIFLLVGDPVTSIDNRFFTLEFLRRLSARMSFDAIFMTEITGVENYAGQEILNYGISIKKTLGKVFERVAVSPGGTTRFFASDGYYPSDDIEVLYTREDRFGELLPKEKLATFFEKSRVKHIQKLYEDYASADSDMFINSMESPRSFFYSLLVLGKFSKSPLTKFLKGLQFSDLKMWGLVLVTFLVGYGFFRRWGVARKDEESVGRIVIFLAGFLSMFLNIAFMYRFQMVFGTIYLYVGLVTSLFMGGLFAGGFFTSLLLPFKRVTISLSLLIIALVVLSCAIFSPASSMILYLLLFTLLGLINGFLAVVGADCFREKDVVDFDKAYLLEMNEHLGAMVGGVVAGVFIIPILGIVDAIWFASLISFLLLFTYLLAQFISAKGERFKHFILFMSFASALLLMRGYLDHIQNGSSGNVTLKDLKSLKIDSSYKVHMRKNQLDIVGQDGKVSFVGSSRDLAPDVSAYGGEINVVGWFSKDGNVLDFFVKEHNETPSFYNRTVGWAKGLVGKNISQLSLIDGVSGATITSDAIKNSLRIMGQTLIKSETFATPVKTVGKPIHSLYFFFALIVAIILMLKSKNLVTRYLWLGFNVIVGGFVFNIQFSLDQVASLFLGAFPFDATNFIFMLVCLLPILVFLFGNFYCGFLCPVGGFLEFLQMLSRKKAPSRKIIVSNLRYYILFFAVLIVVLFKERGFLIFDPLVSIYGWNFSVLGNVIIGLIAFSSTIYPRLWCRYLCPTGAFLSLIASIRPLNRFAPNRYYNRCVYDIKNRYQPGCFECNRCLKDS